MQRAFIEISNACNLSCSFCPSPSIKGKREWMSEELFNATVDSLEGMVQQVFFHVLGEPMLHPLFGTFLSRCALRNLPVNLTTNGVLVREQTSTLLEATALRQINFSLHALQELPDQKEAQRILGDIFAFVLESVKRRPDIYINLRLWNESTGTPSPELSTWNEAVRQQMRDIFQIEFTQRPFHPRHKAQLLFERIYLHADTRFQWPGENDDAEPRLHGSCNAIKTHFAILVDGRIVPCCLDYNGELTLGHVLDGGIKAALAAPRTKAMQYGFSTYNLVEPTCQHCNFCERFPSAPKPKKKKQ